MKLPKGLMLQSTKHQYDPKVTLEEEVGIGYKFKNGETVVKIWENRSGLGMSTELWYDNGCDYKEPELLKNNYTSCPSSPIK